MHSQHARKKMTQRKRRTDVETRYHIEIFRDPNLQRMQNHANAYLEDCQELCARVKSVKLDWLDDEYHLTIVLAIPVEEAEAVGIPL